MRKILTACIALLALLASLAIAQSATASPAVTAATAGTLKMGLSAKTGQWEVISNTAKVAVPSAVQTGYNPIRSATTNRFYFGSNNPERMLCIKDYTPESDASWVARWTATDWSNASPKFGMVWDDMNGNGSYGESNCISYDAMQTINLYSYGDASDGYCVTTDVGYTASGWIGAATVWLNRLADNYQCRYNATMRQNTVGSGVGNILSLQWHTNGNYSIMSLWRTHRVAIANPQASDVEALGRAYATS